MSALCYVRIIRLKAVRGACKGRAQKWKELQPIKNGDWIEGWLLKPIRIGKEFRVRVMISNGAVCRKNYQGSKVISIERDEVTTLHVRYKFLRVPWFDARNSLRAWE